LGGEEINLLLILDLDTRWGEWSDSRPGRALPLSKKRPVLIVQEAFPSNHHHHHHWVYSPTWALAFLRSFCQLKYPAIASSDFMTRVFYRVGLLALRPTPGYPGGPMFSVRVVSLS
jgi:hypothetical protein